MASSDFRDINSLKHSISSTLLTRRDPF